MVGLMIDGCVTIFNYNRNIQSAELMESTTGRVEGFGEEVMVVAAWVCCHSEHSAESHWLSAREAGNSMQGVKEGT